MIIIGGLLTTVSFECDELGHSLKACWMGSCRLFVRN